MTLLAQRSLDRCRGLGLVLALVVATGCGTTVPLATTSAGTGGGAPSVDGSTSGLGGAQTTGTSWTGGSATTTTGAEGLPSAAAGESSGAPDGSSVGASSGSASTGASRPTAGARVVTPLRIGFITVEFGAALQALGSSTSSTTDQDGFKALVKAFNDAGGVAGRRLVPTYQKVDAADTSYQQAGDRACAAFQDAKVEVVVSEAASTYYGFAACLAKGGIPLISSNASDQVGLSQAPWVFNAFAPSYDRGYGAVVDQLVASGYVTPKSKIGAIRITCAEIERAYKSSVLARMKAHHLATPIEYTVSCASGFADAGAYSSAMQSAVLKFQSSGVDRVFVIGDQEALLLSYFAQQAQNQQYHPGYALSSGSLPITLIGASTFPSEQLPQVRGVGWRPLGDTAVDHKTPTEQRCTALATKGGLPPKDVAEKFIVYQGCANLFLLEAALKRGSGSAHGPALRAAILGLGTTFASTGILGGSTVFGPGRQDGPQLASEWGYVSSCNCFRYLGKPSVMQ